MQFYWILISTGKYFIKKLVRLHITKIICIKISQAAQGIYEDRTLSEFLSTSKAYFRFKQGPPSGLIFMHVCMCVLLPFISYLWQSRHSVVMQAGQFKTASLFGTGCCCWRGRCIPKPWYLGQKKKEEGWSTLKPDLPF